jgi:hypothetical protein
MHMLVIPHLRTLAESSCYDITFNQCTLHAKQAGAAGDQIYSRELRCSAATLHPATYNSTPLHGPS